MKSLWENTAEKPDFKVLEGDKKTDVLIIGGGMAGVLCAAELKNRGVDYILLEAEKIGMGITRNTTAKITSQHGLIYNKIISKYGTESAKKYYDANNYAFEKIKLLSNRYKCDFEAVDSYVYSMNDEKILHKELSALFAIGCKADISYNLSLLLIIVTFL